MRDLCTPCKGGPTGTFAYKCKLGPGTFLVPNPTGATTGDYGETYNPASTTQPIRNSFVGAAIQPSQAFQEYYPFQTLTPIRIHGPGEFRYSGNGWGNTFGLNDANLTVILYYGGSAQNTSTVGKAMQTINLHFPPITNLPYPQGPPQQFLTEMKDADPYVVPNADVTTWQAMPPTNLNFGAEPIPNNQASTTSNGGFIGMRHFYWNTAGTFFANYALGIRRTKQPAASIAIRPVCKRPGCWRPALPGAPRRIPPPQRWKRGQFQPIYQ